MNRLLVPLLGALVLAGCSSGAAAPAGPPAAGTVHCSYPASGAAAKPVTAPPPVASTVGMVSLTLRMTGGEVTISGDRARTPCTLNAIESLAKQGYFDDTACHRLADSTMLLAQCGDPSGTGRGGPGFSFVDEIAPGTAYPAGTVAMANAGPNTNGSQFFIVYGDTALPANYTVLGRVDAASLKVIKTMAAEGQDNRYGDGTGKPVNAFRILSASVG